MSLTETTQISAALLNSPIQECTLPYLYNISRNAHHVHHHQRPPLFIPSTASPSPSPPGAIISSSLFISNIPCKIREEEIVELFEGLPGYISGRLRRTKMGNYIAFVEFDTPQNAVFAKSKYNGYNFDTKTVPANSGNLPKHMLKKHGILIDFSRANVVQEPMQFGGATTTTTATTTANGNAFNRMYPPSNGIPGTPDNYFNSLFYTAEFDNSIMEPKYFGGGVEDGELATLYVEGLPCDVTKREVSHIFRHYKGFKDIRIIPKEDKTTRKTFILCFVDFVTRDEAGAAMRDLQGYKMDLELPEQRGLTIYFARTGKLFKN